MYYEGMEVPTSTSMLKKEASIDVLENDLARQASKQNDG
jgi:hypothetical protein